MVIFYSFWSQVTSIHFIDDNTLLSGLTSGEASAALKQQQMQLLEQVRKRQKMFCFLPSWCHLVEQLTPISEDESQPGY